MKRLKDLEKKINYIFKNQNILVTATTHKSFDTNNNYEQLEFLGDRVLGLVISKKLIDIFPNEKEGVLDKKYANLVNKKTCQVIAKQFKLSSYMRYGSSFKNLKTTGDKVLGDCLEAIIGAIFMDSNFNLAEKFVLMSWKNYLNKDKSDLIDSKTKLQEFSLKKYKKLPTYLVLKDIGSKTNPFFQAEVKIPESKKYIGTGKSKKIAQQNAAKNLLKDLNIG
tara:strand:- start:73 stop:738 length:666 start_codon:yes stop_codon:yes gene_type:complete